MKLNRVSKLVLLASFLSIILLITISYQRMTASLTGCPDWILCYDKVYIDENDIPALQKLFPSLTPVLENIQIVIATRYLAIIMVFLAIVIMIRSWFSSSKSNPENSKLLPFLIFISSLFILCSQYMVNLKWQHPGFSIMYLSSITIYMMFSWLLVFRSKKLWIPAVEFDGHKEVVIKWAIFCFIIILMALISGFWVSINYAQDACTEMVFCSQDNRLPIPTLDSVILDYLPRFNYEGGILPLENKQIINFTHRIFGLLSMVMAIIVFIRSKFCLEHAVSKASSLVALIGIMSFALGITIVLSSGTLSVGLIHLLLALLFIISMLILLNILLTRL